MKQQLSVRLYTKAKNLVNDLVLQLINFSYYVKIQNMTQVEDKVASFQMNAKAFGSLRKRRIRALREEIASLESDQRTENKTLLPKLAQSSRRVCKELSRHKGIKYIEIPGIGPIPDPSRIIEIFAIKNKSTDDLATIKKIIGVITNTVKQITTLVPAILESDNSAAEKIMESGIQLNSDQESPNLRVTNTDPVVNFELDIDGKNSIRIENMRGRDHNTYSVILGPIEHIGGHSAGIKRLKSDGNNGCDYEIQVFGEDDTTSRINLGNDDAINDGLAIPTALSESGWGRRILEPYMDFRPFAPRVRYPASADTDP